MPKSRGKLNKVLLEFLIIIISGSLISCSYSAEGKLLFGTFFNMDLKGDNAVKIGEDILSSLFALEDTLSTNIASSDISKINQAEKDIPISVSSDTLNLLLLSRTLYEDTNHAFNPAMFPVVELWNMSPAKYIFTKSVPDEQSIADTLKFTDFNDFYIDETNSTVTKKYKEQKLDLGAIAKGYAVKLALLKCGSLNSALINAGGTIGLSGDMAKIGILDPRGNDLLGSVDLFNSSIATSGDYERFFEIDGIRYHHIFDQSGYPSGIKDLNKIISVSVIAKDAAIADALSTSLFILGSSATDLLTKYNASAVFVYEDKTVDVIGNISFSLINTEYRLND